jgi:diamine N-acetyltransferase
MTNLIARATPEDAELLGELGRSTYRTYFGDIWSEAAFAAYLDRHFEPMRIRSDMAGKAVRYYLARSEDVVVGYAKLILDRPVPGLAAPAAELEKLYLLPEAIGTGVGAALLAHVLEEAASAGFARVWVGELPFATDLHDICFWVMAREG